MARAQPTIQLPSSTFELVRIAAERAGITPADFVREAAVARVYFEMARRGGDDARAAARFIEAARDPSPAPPRTALKAQEVCERLSVSRTWLYALVKQGRVPHVRLGGPHGPIRILEEDLDRLLDEARKARPGPKRSSEPP